MHVFASVQSVVNVVLFEYMQVYCLLSLVFEQILASFIANYQAPRYRKLTVGFLLYIVCFCKNNIKNVWKKEHFKRKQGKKYRQWRSLDWLQIYSTIVIFHFISFIYFFLIFHEIF